MKNCTEEGTTLISHPYLLNKIQEIAKVFSEIKKKELLKTPEEGANFFMNLIYLIPFFDRLYVDFSKSLNRY